MPANDTSASSRITTWLRPIALFILASGFAAERGRMLIIATDQCLISSNGPLYDRFSNQTGLPGIDHYFCILLSVFRDIFIYPISRAAALLFASILVPALLNVFWRARTRSDTFKAFVFAWATQIITFGQAAALFYSATTVPPVIRSEKGRTGNTKQPTSSVSTRYVWWVAVNTTAALPALAALILAPVENDAVYVMANGLFQLYPVIFVLTLLVKPLDHRASATSRLVSGADDGRGVQLVVRLFGLVAWSSAFLHWAGLIGFFVKPAIINEAAHGSHSEVLSPVITSFVSGDWEWSLPDTAQLRGGPIFFILNYVSVVLAVWSSQVESGYPPKLGKAIAGGPAYAITRSMAATWSAAI